MSPRSLNPELLDAFIRPLARRLHADHMSRLGIGNTMRLAHGYNRFKFGRQDRWRRRLFREQMTELVEENGTPATPLIELKDGWAIDESMSLPHLNRVLDDAEEIITQRAGTRKSNVGSYRSYFQDVWTPADLETYPSFVDFATSSAVLSVVAHYLGCIPALSTTLPSGIRFVESSAAYDDQPAEPHDSQLYHLDYYSLPNLYVLVLLRDTTLRHGPWTFLPRSVTQKATAVLRNWQRGVPYRFSDEQVYSVVDRSDVIEFSYRRGTVLFIESSGCLHYGSRNAVNPRFQLMYAYTGACRTDFSEAIMPAKRYPVGGSDSLLRKMALNKNLLK